MHAEQARVLEGVGATLIVVDAAGMAAALRSLVPYGIQSVLLEGGAAVHQAAWDESIVDYVQLYLAPALLGPQGVAFLDGRPLSPASLVEPRVTALGPDVLIEGYVHRPY